MGVEHYRRLPPEVTETATPAPGAPPPVAPAAATPAAATPAAPVATDQPESIAEHEKQHNTRRRHRAASQMASPEDVPRIQNLTRKNRELQEENERLKANGTAQPAASTATATPAPKKPADPAQAAARTTPSPVVSSPDGPALIPVLAADKDPEPDPADYVDAPEKNYVKDQARWEARQEIREANERAVTEHRTRTEAAARDQLTQSWARREVVAKAKYADFEKIAYAPTRIPQGSMVDNYIIEAESGLDVLYHLQKHPAELDRLLAMQLFDPATGTYPQLEALASLSRRLAPGATTDGTTGASAAAPAATRLPKPPTPVRTGPIHVPTDEPPGDDASIAEHEAHWGKKRR